MSKSVVATARISLELADQIDLLAAKLDRSRAWVIQQAIARFVETELEFLAYLQEGIDAADRGDLISQEEMETWFEARTQRAAAE